MLGLFTFFSTQKKKLIILLTFITIVRSHTTQNMLYICRRCPTYALKENKKKKNERKEKKEVYLERFMKFLFIL